MLQYMGRVPLFVGGNEGRIYERVIQFRDRFIQYMITWKSHFVFSQFDFCFVSTCPDCTEPLTVCTKFSQSWNFVLIFCGTHLLCVHEFPYGI